jgi:galactose mutarotase-like enzyme
MAETLVPRAGKENVLIQAGNCSLTFLPHLGGKIASLRVNDSELLQTPLIPYGQRNRIMTFDEGDASGWDECLPSVSGCRVEIAAGHASIPDHGDLWRVVWQPMVRSADSATFRGDCFSLPLALERSVKLTEAAEGWKLRLDYKVTNTGAYAAPWSWSAHPLFAAEAGDRILLPDSLRELRLESSRGDRLGRTGDLVSWPMATLANGHQTDLSEVQPPSSGTAEKLFAGALAPSENWCALERPKAGVRITVRFDPAATPYLGLWICYGGWPARPGPKQMCVALEPSTAGADSLAQTGPWSRVLAPGDSFCWPMDVEIEPLEGVAGHA